VVYADKKCINKQENEVFYEVATAKTRLRASNSVRKE
jgi:hypothetical protein